MGIVIIEWPRYLNLNHFKAVAAATASVVARHSTTWLLIVLLIVRRNQKRTPMTKTKKILNTKTPFRGF